MKVTTEWIGAAGDTECPESLTDRGAQRLKLLTGNTGDHRPCLGENLRYNQADDQRNPLVRTDSLEAGRDDAKTVPAVRRVDTGTPTFERRAIPGLHLDPLQTADRSRVPDRLQQRIQIVRSAPGLHPRAPLRESVTPPLITLCQARKVTGGDTNKQVTDVGNCQLIQALASTRIAHDPRPAGFRQDFE